MQRQTPTRFRVGAENVTRLRRQAPGGAVTLPGLYQVQHVRDAQGRAVSVAIPPAPDLPLDATFDALTRLRTSPPIDVPVLYDDPHWVDPGQVRSLFADAPDVKVLSLVEGPSVHMVIRSDGLTRLTYSGAEPPDLAIPVGRGLPDERTVWAAASPTLEPLQFLESGPPEPVPGSTRIRFREWVDGQRLTMGQAEVAAEGDLGSLALIEFADGSLALAAAHP